MEIITAPSFIAKIVLISAYGMAEMYKASFGKKNEVVAVVTDPNASGYDINKHGEALFNAQCIVCHGADGKANLAGAKDLTISDKSAEDIEVLIKKGKNTMPKMEGIYNEVEIEALINYVMSLR